jgi:regulatory protein
MIARREYCSGELVRELAGRGYAAEVVQATLDELVEQRYVDDHRYAETFVRSHSQRGHGPRRLRQDMAAAGLPSDLIDEALAAGPDWKALARDVRERRFGAEPPEDWAERARQSRFLQYRGFSNDHIASALGSSEAPDLDPEE